MKLFCQDIGLYMICKGRDTFSSVKPPIKYRIKEILYNKNDIQIVVPNRNYDFNIISRTSFYKYDMNSIKFYIRLGKKNYSELFKYVSFTKTLSGVKLMEIFQ